MNITSKAAKFLRYWRKYCAADLYGIARHNALTDGRKVICLNDVEAAFAQLIGPLWSDWS